MANDLSIMIAAVLLSEMHIPKGYVDFAMGFSVFVEMINLRVRGSAAPVKLHEPYQRSPIAPPGARPLGRQLKWP